MSSLGQQTPAVQDLEITAAMEELENMVNNMDSAITVLLSRADKVLIPAVPAAASNQGEPGRIYETSLGIGIHTQALRVRDLFRMINSAIARIQL